MQVNVKTYGAAILLGASLLMWGCSDNASVNPSATALSNGEHDNLADDFGSALAAPGEGMLTFWANNGSGGGAASTDTRLPVSSLDDTMSFDRDGFHVVLVRNYYDSLGNFSPTFDPATSVRLERKLWIDGTHTNQSGRRTVTLHHFDSTEVLGIQPAALDYLLNGAGHRTVNSQFASRFDQNMKTVEAAYEWTVDTLVVSHDRETNPYPLSGSIAVDATITRTHENPGRHFQETVTVSLVVYFNGTRYAHLVFADGTEYWIDLQDGCPFHRHP